MYHPSVPCVSKLLRLSSGSKATNFVPGGDNSAVLQSKFPLRCASAESYEFLWELQSRLIVMHACGMSLSHRCNGKSGSVPARMEIKLFLMMRMCPPLYFSCGFLVALVAIVFDFFPYLLGGVWTPHCLIYGVLA